MRAMAERHQTAASESPDVGLPEIDGSTDMDALNTAVETGGTELLALAEEPPPGVADAREVSATPPSEAERPPAAPSSSSPVDTPAAVQRPDWVESPPGEVDGQLAEVLVSDPFETGDECDQDIQRRMIAAVQRFADRQVRRIGAPRGINLPVRPEDLSRISRQRFVDVIPTSVGPMKQAYRLIVFDEPFRQVLDRRITEAMVGQRLVRTGAFSGGVLLLLGSLFGILKGAARRQAKAASA